jgi:hypothetical protein
MTGFFDDFKRGFAQARADTARPALRRKPAVADDPGGEATPENGADKESLAEVTALGEQYELRVKELEAELAASPAAIYAEVLRLPGVKAWLANRFHPDKPDVKDGEREWLTARMQKVNAAYAALEEKGRQEP